MTDGLSTLGSVAEEIAVMQGFSVTAPRSFMNGPNASYLDPLSAVGVFVAMPIIGLFETLFLTPSDADTNANANANTNSSTNGDNRGNGRVAPERGPEIA
eukprot:jgi/Hompol1/2827/HPOL_006187-RA